MARKRARMKPLEMIEFGDIRELEGAVKVCVRYGKKTEDSLTRCLQWSAGPGYAEGPVQRGTITDPKYFIQEVRTEAGIRRPYRYRSGRRPLPYPPRTVRGPGGVTEGAFNPLSVRTQEKWNVLPAPVKAKVLQIIQAGSVDPLTAEEILLLQQGSPQDTES